MNGDTKTVRAGLGRDELRSLRDQLNELKVQTQRLLGTIEGGLRRLSFSGKEPRGKTVATQNTASHHSPLDQVKAVWESTADLRETNGNLSAVRIAKVFGVSVSQLAGWLGRSKQALSKTPDADSVQEQLRCFERVARLRILTNGDADFRKWLRISHEALDDASPLELLSKREWQALADYVEDILTGNPG